MSQTFLLETRGRVAHVTLNRPEVLNAINHEARINLAQALQRLSEDPEVRVVVLRGAGRSFCAGQDQKESSQFDAENADRRIETYGRLFDTMRRLVKPVIARVHGYAAGAGLQVALLADLRIAGESARLGLTELKVGSAAITGSALLWPIAGEAVAKWLYLTGQFVGAQEALRLGMVHEVLPDAELDARVDLLARELSERAPLAIKLTKEWWRMLTEETFQKTLRHAHEAHAANFAAGGLSHGARSFVARKAK